MPAPKRLIDYGATVEIALGGITAIHRTWGHYGNSIAQFIFDLTSCSNINKRIFRGIGRVYRTYLQALRLLANPPLRLIENSAISQFDRADRHNLSMGRS
ncbi:hypothetical protein [Microcoleus sp. B7-D4]|uniref:hypothetical protein n=1 Tax=Microcoleus sp. B7-D4 TaxID=2818696 RepID=UPI002FD33772